MLQATRAILRHYPISSPRQRYRPFIEFERFSIVSRRDLTRLNVSSALQSDWFQFPEPPSKNSEAAYWKSLTPTKCFNRHYWPWEYYPSPSERSIFAIVSLYYYYCLQISARDSRMRLVPSYSFFVQTMSPTVPFAMQNFRDCAIMRPSCNKWPILRNHLSFRKCPTSGPRQFHPSHKIAGPCILEPARFSAQPSFLGMSYGGN
jgi:hypothetical protein